MHSNHALCAFLWLTALSVFAQQPVTITHYLKKADIESVTGVALKEPAVEAVDFSRVTIARYRAVKPRPYDAEVCIISLGALDPIQYAN